jgi:hypothetical protein
MAVRHTAWRVDVLRAASTLQHLSSSEDLLGPEVTALAERVRADPERHFLLVMLRLDPTDDEAWTAVLEPRRDDAGYEVAAAERLMLLLVRVCVEAAGIRSPPSYLASHLAASGWSRERVELAIHGKPISSFLAQVAPGLRDIVSQSSPWLTGGWLDGPTAAGLRSDLQRDLPSLQDRIADTAAQQSSQSGLEPAWHEETLRAALGDLTLMLAQPTDGQAIWIIED